MTKFCKNKREVRTTAGRLCVREAGHGTPSGAAVSRESGEADGDVIEGVAIVFDDDYRVTDYYGDTYVERIAPGAVTDEWLKTQDVKLNLLHVRELTLARNNRGKGNLELWTEKDGVHFRFAKPDCDLGERAKELVKKEVYTGCSFEFYPKDYNVTEEKDADGNVVTVVTHTAFESLEALTIAMDPAYEKTEVTLRELRESAGKGGQHAGIDRREGEPDGGGSTATDEEEARMEAHDHAVAEARWEAAQERRNRRRRMNENIYC